MEIYHETFTKAINEALNSATDKNLVVNNDDIFTYVTAGNGRPKSGKTFRCSLRIENSKKGLHIQIYNTDKKSKPYELNSYIL